MRFFLAFVFLVWIGFKFFTTDSRTVAPVSRVEAPPSKPVKTIEVKAQKKRSVRPQVLVRQQAPTTSEAPGLVPSKTPSFFVEDFRSSDWLLAMSEKSNAITAIQHKIIQQQDGSQVMTGISADGIIIRSEVLPDGTIRADEVEHPDGRKLSRLYDEKGRLKAVFFKQDSQYSFSVNLNERGKAENIQSFSQGKMSFRSNEKN